MLRNQSMKDNNRMKPARKVNGPSMVTNDWAMAQMSQSHAMMNPCSHNQVVPVVG